MRQVLYVSSSTAPGDEADLAGILQQSRHNNAIDGITGLLWSDGRSFMQVIEGSCASIEPTLARVLADRRHHSLRILSDRLIEVREFGTWNMAHRRVGDAADEYDTAMTHFLSRASDPIREQFLTLVATGDPASVPAQVASR